MVAKAPMIKLEMECFSGHFGMFQWALRAHGRQHEGLVQGECMIYPDLIGALDSTDKDF